MKKRILSIILYTGIIITCDMCSRPDCHEQMLGLISQIKHSTRKPDNLFAPSAKLVHMDSLLAVPHSTVGQKVYCKFLKAHILLELGREPEAIALLSSLIGEVNPVQARMVEKELGIAHLRDGERSNCIAGHAAESCVMPIEGLGLHRDPEGSRKAIEHYLATLKNDPNDLESRWLLNVAYMTIGEYPSKVPKAFLLPGLEGDTTVKVNPFQDIAGGLGLAVNNMAGGTIIEDFDNDGQFDIVNSSMDLDEPMHYFHNNGDGSFSDLSEKSGLSKFTGGLNMVQADYDNDGDKDILVLRGAWKGRYGNEPNSLLQNQGNGIFRDVTTISGILSYHPTQTATWNDFNNDGWLDVFIGNETSPYEVPHPCELYINNTDGTFRNIAQIAGIKLTYFVKGVTSGDYDNDGLKDIFLSTMDGKRLLFKNRGQQGKEIAFEDVTVKAGISIATGSSFPTWFWDYNNDGWLDIFACDYTFQHSLAFYAAAEKLNIPAGNSHKAYLFKNNKDGTFTNVAGEAGLNKIIFAMGSNFGDIDNDGYLDAYLGTGNPPYQSIIPNKMYKNMGGEKFADVTTSAKVGHLQKGHGVAFADMDNDGDQDIFIEMGGAYTGDSYPNSFFLNPGQGDNNWIKIDLRGTIANKDAIGSQIKITFTENGRTRSVYRDVNSGGSFGASPLRREIGIGQAKQIDEIEIRWHGSNTVQRFTNLACNQFLRITEGNESVEKIPLKRIEWKIDDPLCLPSASQTVAKASAL